MKKNTFFTLLFLLYIPATLAAAQVNSFRIIGYFYNKWGNVNNIQFGYLNTINYCFASISASDGSIKEDFDTEKLRQVVTQAHKRNIKVLLTIGGPNTRNQFSKMASSSQKRGNFISSALKLVKNYNLDGLDIDWEYPVVIDGSSANFVRLLKGLFPLLNKQGKLLSIAANANGIYADGIPSGVFPYISYLNIMAYDDPNKSRPSHSTYTFANEALSYWIDKRGLPKEKAILGIPSYGKSTKLKKVIYYKDLVSEGANPRDDSFQSVDYNGLTTIKQKATLAKQRAGGIFMWEINLDTKDSTSLLRAVHAVCN